jgi:hypothetical protein
LLNAKSDSLGMRLHSSAPEMLVANRAHALPVHQMLAAYLSGGSVLLLTPHDLFYTTKDDEARIRQYAQDHFVYLESNDIWINPYVIDGITPHTGDSEALLLLSGGVEESACTLTSYPSPGELQSLSVRADLTESITGVYFSRRFAALLTPEFVYLASTSPHCGPIPVSENRAVSFLAAAEADGWLPFADGSYANPDELRIVDGGTLGFTKHFHGGAEYKLSRSVADLTEVGKKRLASLPLFDIGSGQRIHLRRAFHFDDEGRIWLGRYISPAISVETKVEIKAAMARANLPIPTDGDQSGLRKH